jgi:hypothetical protein
MTNEHTAFGTSLRYELAISALDMAMAGLSSTTAEAQSVNPPDAAKAALLEDQKSELRGIRRNLDPDNADQIEEVIARFAPIVREQLGG